MRLALLALAPSLMLAAVDGLVMNQTTSKPQPGATVTLIQLGNAMNTLGSATTDARGRFKLDQSLAAGAPHLIQVMHQGVTYNTMLQPGGSATGLNLAVYDSSANAPDAKVAQHMILVERATDGIKVAETVIYANSGNVTFDSPGGTLKIYAPPSISGSVRASIQGPQGMPIQRPPEKGTEPNVYVIKYPIKPGETRIDLSYSLAADAEWQGKILHGGGPVRIVAPQGVKLEGAGLTELGSEPRTRAMIYDLKATNFALKVSGTGTLRESATSAGGGAEASDDTPAIEQQKPRVYKRIYLVVGLALAMLGAGFALLYRMGDAPSKEA